MVQVRSIPQGVFLGFAFSVKFADIQKFKIMIFNNVDFTIKNVNIKKLTTELQLSIAS
jgi:hypothetical protein